MATVLTIALGGTLWSFAKNQNVSWPTVGTFLFNGLILHGIVVTLYLTVVAMVIGVIGGTLVATMRTSKNPIVSSIAKAYVWFFRGTPILIQIIFWQIGWPISSVYRPLSWYSVHPRHLVLRAEQLADHGNYGRNSPAGNEKRDRLFLGDRPWWNQRRDTRANRSGVLTSLV